MRFLYLVPVISSLLVNSVSAMIVADWNTAPLAGNESSVSPASAATNITGLSLTRGSGLAGSVAGGSFSSTGWDNNTQGAGSSEFISFGFTVSPGFAVNLSTVDLGTRSSNTGPGTMGLYYSGNNFSVPLASFTQPNGVFVNSSVDVSSLVGLTGTVEFRLIEIGNTAPNGSATANTGTFRVTDYFVSGVKSTNLEITGAVNSVAVPEPGAVLFGGLVCGVLGLTVAGRRALGCFHGKNPNADPA